MKYNKIKEGSLVEIELMDGEEGFLYRAKGIITKDWEKINYEKKVDIKLDSGRMVLMYPKWMLKRNPQTKQHETGNG